MEFDLSAAQVTPPSVSGSYYGNYSADDFRKKDPKEIGAAFESIFYRMLFKNMQEAELDENILGGNQMDTFREMQYDEFAHQMGKKGELGFIDMVVDFVKERQGEHVVNPEDFKGKFALPNGLLKG
jgi:Rod binding domain-containing protein